MENLLLAEDQMVPVKKSKNEKRAETEQDPVTRAEGILLDMWLEEFEKSAVFPTVNEETWREHVHDAHDTGGKLLFLGVGCPAWAEILDERGDLHQFLRDLPRDGRPFRFARASASLQRALGSFGVDVLPVLTLSKVEAMMRWKVGSERVMTDKSAVVEMIETSQQTMSELLSEEGCQAVFFDHMDFIGTETAEAFDRISSESEMREFGKDLILRDVRELPGQIAEFLTCNDDIPPKVVWIDVMAEKAEKERVWVTEAIESLENNLPAIAPFRNASRWVAREVAQESFVTKEELASIWLGVDMPDSITRETWLRQVLAMSDADVEKKLHELGIDVKINSMRGKNDAVELIERVVFGESSFVDGKLVQKISISGESTVLAVLVEATNQKGNHIRGLLSEGRVRLNGMIVQDPTRAVMNGDFLQAGKKINLRILQTHE